MAQACDDEDAANARGSLVDAGVRAAYAAVSKWRGKSSALTTGLRNAARGASAAAPDATVTFTTSHKAKGLEFDTVVVHDDFASFLDDTTAEPKHFISQEELHAWHVALTRAKRNLYLPPKFDALRNYHAKINKTIPGAPLLLSAESNRHPNAAGPPPPPQPPKAPVSIAAMMMARKTPNANARRHPAW